MSISGQSRCSGSGPALSCRGAALSLLTNVTRPPTATLASNGISPNCVIDTLAVADGEAGVGAGAGAGAGAGETGWRGRGGWRRRAGRAATRNGQGCLRTRTRGETAHFANGNAVTGKTAEFWSQYPARARQRLPIACH